MVRSEGYRKHRTAPRPATPSAADSQPLSQPEPKCVGSPSGAMPLTPSMPVTPSLYGAARRVSAGSAGGLRLRLRPGLLARGRLRLLLRRRLLLRARLGLRLAHGQDLHGE